jgi:hexosaminidase
MKSALIRIGILLLASTQAGAFSTQAEIDGFARHTALTFGVTSNFNASGMFSGTMQLSNASPVALAPGAGEWRIYLHSIRKLEDADASGLRVSHVQGDLHSLAPTAAFPGLAAGESMQIAFSGANWIVSYSDFMPRAFIAMPGLKPAVLANTDTEDLPRFVLPFKNREQQLRQPDDRYTPATARSRFIDNLAVNGVSVNEARLLRRIFPTPKRARYLDGDVALDGSWRIVDETAGAGGTHHLQRGLLQQAGLDLPVVGQQSGSAQKSIRLRFDSALTARESYRLDIGDDGISIHGSDAAGVYYGIQSLLGLIPAKPFEGGLKLPMLHAEDSPRFGWRGMHYDMARNFHGKQVTLRLIEQMGRYKLNRLHLHLSDDEGWRLQIPGLPELTDIGARRCFDLSEQRCLLTQLGTGPNENGSGNGYYSRADFIEILKYAAERHIEVIPEVDMPGHGRAAIKAMQARYRRLMRSGEIVAAQQYLLSDPSDTSTYLSVQGYTDNSVNVCQQSSYDFIGKVVSEIEAMYRDAGLRLEVFHMGGDEVAKGSWLASPRCLALIADTGSGVKDESSLKPYFVKQVAALLAKKGIAFAGWEDALMLDATTPFARGQLQGDRVIANVWDNIWEWGVADRAYRLANAGYNVVLSHATHLYFDHPQETSPDERGYYWASRFTDSRKVFGYMPDDVYANADKTRMGEPITDLERTVGRPLPKLEKPENVIGMQGHVWSETIRTPEQLERLVYPRMLLMAERAWHKAPWEGAPPDPSARDVQWAETARLIALRELPKLQAQGVHVYLPKPGVSVQKGMATANAALPGLALSYSTDQNTWHPFKRPVPFTTGKLCFRSQAFGPEASAAQCVPDDQ